MKIAFILNPHSGGNQRRPWLANTIRSYAESRGIEAQLCLTERGGHATELAQAAIAAGCDRVVAIGGDGTLNEVARPLIGTSVRLGLLPSGSGNGLGRHLGLHRPFTTVLDWVTHPEPTTLAVDTGEVNGRPFFNVMGLGFDADVGDRFNRLEQRGFLAYAGVTVASLREMRPFSCRVTLDGQTESLDALIIAVANSSQYGNRALIAPEADVADGKLDFVLVKPVGLVGAGTLVPRLFLGNLDRSPLVRHQQARQIVIERPGPGLVHTDGETFQAGERLEVTVRAGALQIIVPPETVSGRAVSGGAVWPARA